MEKKQPSVEDIKGILLQNNVVKNFLHIDAEIILAIHAGIDYPIFITEDEIYDRETLCDQFSFEKFNVLPEKIFKRQEVGTFTSATKTEHVTRDVNDTTEESDDIDFMPLSPDKYKLISVVKTNIYIGKSAWKEFHSCFLFAKGASRIALSQEKNGKKSLFLEMLGGSVNYASLEYKSGTTEPSHSLEPIGLSEPTGLTEPSNSLEPTGLPEPTGLTEPSHSVMDDIEFSRIDTLELKVNCLKIVMDELQKQIKIISKTKNV